MESPMNSFKPLTLSHQAVFFSNLKSLKADPQIYTPILKALPSGFLPTIYQQSTLGPTGLGAPVQRVRFVRPEDNFLIDFDVDRFSFLWNSDPKDLAKNALSPEHFVRQVGQMFKKLSKVRELQDLKWKATRVAYVTVILPDRDQVNCRTLYHHLFKDNPQYVSPINEEGGVPNEWMQRVNTKRDLTVTTGKTERIERINTVTTVGTSTIGFQSIGGFESKDLISINIDLNTVSENRSPRFTANGFAQCLKSLVEERGRVLGRILASQETQTAKELA